jgi:hypothetical protein
MSECRILDTNLSGADLREFSYRLLNEPNYIPDVLHSVKQVMEAARETFSVCQQPYALVNGTNKIGGVFFVSNVVPEHEAVFYVWCWDGKCISSKTMRFLKDYIRATADEYLLCRMVARTPDKKLGHLLEHLSFKEEARQKWGWKSGGRLSTLYQYRILFGR